MIGSERLGLGSVPTAAGAGDGGAPPGTFVESVEGNGRGVTVDNTDPQNPKVGLTTFPLVTGYLAQLFAAGVADNPALDNTLVGSYFNNFFDADGSIKITQKASTSGVDSQVNPALTLTRKFTAAGISGLGLKTVTQIDGTGLQSGGVWQQSYLKDTPGTEFEIVAHNDFWNPSLSPNYYDPAYSPLDNVGFSGLSLRDRAGAMRDIALWSGDGNLTIAPRLPNDGLARIMGALFLDGSQDGLGMADGQGFGIWTWGRDDLGFREPMSRIDTYWLDSTFVGPIPAMVLRLAQGGVWHDVFALSVAAATFNEPVTAPNLPNTVYTDEVDFTAAPAGGYVFRPSTLQRAGYYFIGQRYNLIFTAGAGTATGSLVFSAGNDAQQANVVGGVTGPGFGVTVTAAVINGAIGVGAPVGVSQGQALSVAVPLGNASTAITFRVQTAVTGVTTLRGRLVINGTWVPV